MTLRLRITVRAVAQIERADAWWRKNRQAAPEAVREDLKSTFEILLLQPGIGERVDNQSLLGTRSLQIDRIGYDIYYRAHGEELVVLALWHSHRGRRPKV